MALFLYIGLNLIKDLTNGSMEGGSIGSTEITLRPGQIGGGEFSVDTKTAGYLYSPVLRLFGTCD
jgi:RNA 3'-terminal phosphate cyclase